MSNSPEDLNPLVVWAIRIAVIILLLSMAAWAFVSATQ